MRGGTSARYFGLMVALALAWASAADAQTYVNGKKPSSLTGGAQGWFGSDSTYYDPMVAQPMPMTDVNNPASVNTNTYYPNILDTGGTGIIPGNRLVSSAKDTRGWRKQALSFWMTTTNNDSCAVAYFAVSVRGGYLASNDSLAMAPWLGWTQSASTDTIGGAANYLLNSGTDVSSLSTTMTLLPGERLMVVSMADGKRAGYVELQRNGEWFEAPYTAVACRLLRVNFGTAITTTATTVAIAFRSDLVRVE